MKYWSGSLKKRNEHHMIDIIILVLLLMGTLLGLKRGFILQFIYLTSFILSIAFAALFTKTWPRI